MTIEQLWAIIRKQWKLIVVCFVSIGVGTLGVSTYIKPTYQSTALVQVTLYSGSSQSDYNSLLASDQLVQTEVQLATSDPVLREVASHHPKLTVERLSKQVTATSKLNTQLFEIDVQDASPTEAAMLANDVAATLIKQQLQESQRYNNRSQQQLQQDLDSTKQQIDDINTQIVSLSNRGGKQSQITTLQSQLSSLQQHYNQWQTSLAQLELMEAQNSDYLRIAQPAQPALVPVKPQVLLNTSIGLGAGLFVGILLAMLLEQLNTRVQSAEQLSELLGLPVLATIRHVNIAKGEEVLNPQEQNTNSESYRILRTNIGFSSIDKPLRSVAITSAVSQEGKSTTSVNLAIFMAKAGKSTLLIDADLRSPSIHENFGLFPDRMGLSNAIVAFARSQFHSNPMLPHQSALGLSLDPYMHSVGIPNLRVMPSGPLPPNPSELLDSKAMERFFRAVENCGIEMILFDTPPLLGLSDTSILASKVDGTLIVTDVTHAKKDNMSRVKAILAQSGANVIGCIVNKESVKRKVSNYALHQRKSQQRIAGPHNSALGRPMTWVPATPMYPIHRY